MPFAVDLYVPCGDAWQLLLRCPGIRVLAQQAEEAAPEQLDVTALALEEDAGGTAYPLSAEDAAFLRAEGQHPVLLPDRAKYPEGESAAGFAGTLRVAFLGWIASVARQLRCPISIRYSHERGDWLYESASWDFVPEEALLLLDFGGDEEIHWSARITEAGSDEIDYDA